MASNVASRFIGSPEALRRMIAGHERAAQVSRAAAVASPPEEAFDAALDLWALCPERLTAAPDALREREVEQARAAWKTIKARMGK